MPHIFAPETAVAPAALHLVEEISHRVVNEFCEAISMISIAAERAQDDIVQDTLERAADRLRSHAQSHLALLPPRTEGILDLARHLEQVCGALSKAFIADNGVRLVLQADSLLLPAERCWRIGLIVTELVRNAARHGLGGGAGLVLVRVISEADGLSCIVCDNGSGVAKVSGGGLGRKLVRNLAAALGGTVHWRFNAHGATAQADFPVDGAAGAARVHTLN